MKAVFSDIHEWLLEAARVMRRQFSLVFSDMGVMLFFFFLPVVYPVVYSLIYNTEVTRDMPVAVVDNCRTAQSREFVRHADATEAIKICGYAADLNEARRWMNEHRCYGVLEIPADYSARLGRGEQAMARFYCDMGLLYRYRTFLSSLTELQMATCTELRQTGLNLLGVSSSAMGESVETQAFFLGDTQQGFASFIIPGIVVLILQQSMLLGIAMLDGASNERRRRNRGYDPVAVRDASPSASCIGKALCYVAIYLPLTLFILHYIPELFAYPHQGDAADYLLFIFPMLLATAFLGISLQGLMRERESAFIVVVFTSVVFLFLSGLTWPRYAMNDFYLMLGNLVPATWGIEGFIRINTNGGSLADQATPYHWLWGLTALFFVTAYLTTRRRSVTD